MQVDPGDRLEEYVFAAFDEMYAAFERDRLTLGPDQLYEIRYEDLVADPVAKMREVYEKLGLEGFEAALPAFEAQGRSMKAYRTNTYRHDPRIVAEISRRWQPFLDRYGYSAPST